MSLGWVPTVASARLFQAVSSIGLFPFRCPPAARPEARAQVSAHPHDRARAHNRTAREECAALTRWQRVDFKQTQLRAAQEMAERTPPGAAAGPGSMKDRDIV